MSGYQLPHPSPSRYWSSPILTISISFWEYDLCVAMAVLFCFSSWTLPSMRTSMSHLGSHGFTLDDVWINRQENDESSCVAVGVSVNSNKLLGSPSCPSYALYYHGLVAWECKIISWINHCYWLALRACVVGWVSDVECVGANDKFEDDIESNTRRPWRKERNRFNTAIPKELKNIFIRLTESKHFVVWSILLPRSANCVNLHFRK